MKPGQLKRTEFKRKAHPRVKAGRVGKARTLAGISPVEDGSCTRCERWGHLEGHHILYRSQSPQLISEPYNIMPLCGECHREAHRSKIRFYAWLDGHEPGRLDTLRAMHKERSKEVPR